jgi:hypothetical protein
VRLDRLFRAPPGELGVTAPIVVMASVIASVKQPAGRGPERANVRRLYDVLGG